MQKKQYRLVIFINISNRKCFNKINKLVQTFSTCRMNLKAGNRSREAGSISGSSLVYKKPAREQSRRLTKSMTLTPLLEDSGWAVGSKPPSSLSRVGMPQVFPPIPDRRVFSPRVLLLVLHPIPSSIRLLFVFNPCRYVNGAPV